MHTKTVLFSLNPLDKNFVVAKPQTTVSDERICELEACGRLVATRKRDGYCGLATVTGTKRHVRLYTRGIADTSARFPHIIESIRDTAVPTNSLLHGEMFFRGQTGEDYLDIFSRFSKSNPARAILLQEELGRAEFMVFAPIVANGRDVSVLPFGDRHAMAAEWLDRHPIDASLSPMRAIPSSLENLKSLVHMKGWEGLVLYDKSAPSAYGLDGRTEDPPRPDGCWKWKPIFEDDFIVRKFAWGTGKNADRMGKLFLSQIDPVTGLEVACGEVAGGFSREKKLAFSQMSYPCVIQVQFESRTRSGACRVASFMRIRDDKELAGCVLPADLHGLSQQKKK